MKEILVDGCELIRQLRVEVLNDFIVFDHVCVQLS